MLHSMRNMAKTGNKIVQEGLQVFRRHLPPGWSVAAHAGAAVEVSAPDGRMGVLALTPRARLAPKDVLPLADELAAGRGIPVVIAPFLTESTRARLREHGLWYLDLTGNVRIVLTDPGLFIEAQGASIDPNREARPARSLRGPKAGRVIRALIEHTSPPGVRELAGLTGIDAGYVSRVLSFLDSEALVTRVERGRISQVDWPALLRRWAQAAPLDRRGRLHTFLEPRGLSALQARLANSDLSYAITGSLAAATLAPLAPARLATIWVPDATVAAERLGLRPTETGANVVLAEASDESVFDGAVQRDRLWYAAPVQVAADLLTSPARGPQEGEALIDWMQAHEDRWRQ
jgi:transcriptional regulator with XRE-family HTH domain